MSIKNILSLSACIAVMLLGCGGSKEETKPSNKQEPTDNPASQYDVFYSQFMIPATEEYLPETLAFPGAEGCGKFTSGGRGGRRLSRHQS